MGLSGPQREQIIHALKAAFPEQADFTFMTSTKLEDIAAVEMAVSLTSNYRDYLLAWVKQMDARERIKELLRGAYSANSTNTQLIKCCVDLGVLTAPESADLPPLLMPGDPLLQPGALFTHRDAEIIAWSSKYYREEAFIAPGEALRWGITESCCYVVLVLQTLLLDQPAQQVALRLLVDERAQPGRLYCNQFFAEDSGLLPHGERSWSVYRAQKVVPLREICFELRVERLKMDREISALREHRRGLFLDRPLLVEQTTSLTSLSLQVSGLGYFHIRALEPVLSSLAPETLLILNEHTSIKLVVPHQKSAVDMVVLVDVSWSMTIKDYVGEDDLPHSRLEGVQLALQTLLERSLLTSDCRVSRLAILVFGNTTAMLYPTSPVIGKINSAKKAQELRQAIEQKLSSVGLRTLKVERHPTNIATALSAAADILMRSFLKETEKIFILLSDGASWDDHSGDFDSDVDDEIISAADDPVSLADSLHMDKDIRIHTVAISNEEAYRNYCASQQQEMRSGNSPNIPLLQKISAAADGFFFESPDAKSLRNLFDELGRGDIYSLL